MSNDFKVAKALPAQMNIVATFTFIARGELHIKRAGMLVVRLRG